MHFGSNEEFLREIEEMKLRSAQLESRLHEVESELRQAKATVSWMETSKFWQLRSKWLKIKEAIGIPRYKTINIPQFMLKFLIESDDIAKSPKNVKAKPGIPSSTNQDYQQWLNQNYRSPEDLDKIRQTVIQLKYRPIISVVMPVYNPNKKFLREAIDSVVNQVYPYWELCIADDASAKLWVRKFLEECAQMNPKIKLCFRSTRGHISQASNSAIKLASGEFIAFLDQDDTLSLDALYEVANLCNQYPDTDMIYSDEDKIALNNKFENPFFKPDWCPDSFLSRMYTNHLGVYRHSLLREIGGFRIGYEGSQDYDLVLRLTEKTNKIMHLPKILYHWRIHNNSTALNFMAKPYSHDSAQRALQEALERRGQPGQVFSAPNGHHIIRYQIKNPDGVSIIIPTRNLGKILDNCLNSIFTKTTYPNYEVIVIDNGSDEPMTFKVFEKWKKLKTSSFNCLKLDIPFNYSIINNWAVQQVSNKYLLFLNNDIEVITPNWLEGMVEQAQRPTIGAVGATLLYPDNTIQHAGVIQFDRAAGHGHKYFPADAPGYFNQLQSVSNYSAVTGACLMCRQSVFQEIGGFDETLAVAFNDIDLCLKMRKQGYWNVCLPHVRLYHYESKSRGLEDTIEKQIRFQEEVNYFRKKWPDFINHDPCYSPHLSREKEDFSLRVDSFPLKTGQD